VGNFLASGGPYLIGLGVHDIDRVAIQGEELDEIRRPFPKYADDGADIAGPQAMFGEVCGQYCMSMFGDHDRFLSNGYAETRTGVSAPW